jgi:NAD(P)-dependent dehydrogenase (short-subunit alcohol dehydrogenase family)
MEGKFYKNMQNILVTGAAGFLGSQYVSFLAKKHNVFAIDINLKKLLFLKKNIKNIEIFKVDIAKELEVKKIFQKFKKNKIFINVLINNAAIDAVPKNYKNNNVNIETWNKEISVGLTGSFLMIKYFGSEMSKKKVGKIINIGSDLSVIAPNQDIYKGSFANFVKPVTYSVIKHGLLGMTKYYASLYANKNINVNMLSPGPIYNNQKKSFVKKLIKLIPKKRMGDGSELFSAIEFLINKKNSYMTGQNLLIDGGRTIV